MTPAQRRAWLKLARTDTVGPVAFAHLLERFGDAEAALNALPDLARNAGRTLKLPADSLIDRELEAGEALGAQLLCSAEHPFPALLAAVDPPPPVLWVRGDTRLLSRSAVAIVGARVASASAKQFARGMAAELGAAGQIIVSGLARGVDASAHEGALRTGTVAVVAGGVDDIYPPEHANLYAQIVEQGCVVSENEPGRKAIARDFPRRNRIISGLSRAVVVVEAEIRSGSLITARLAAEQGREVLAVPGSPLDPRARGANDLIRQGATLCEGADDVLRALEGLSGLREPDRRYDGGGYEPDARLREQVAALLSPTPAPIDEIVRAAGAPAALVFAALVELAVAGRCELEPGGLASRI